jgi:hypothetical protein
MSQTFYVEAWFLFTKASLVNLQLSLCVHDEVETLAIKESERTYHIQLIQTQNY